MFLPDFIWKIIENKRCLPILQKARNLVCLVIVVDITNLAFPILIFSKELFESFRIIMLKFFHPPFNLTVQPLGI